MSEIQSPTEIFYEEHLGDAMSLFVSVNKTEKYSPIGEQPEEPFFLSTNTTGTDFKKRYKACFPKIPKELVIIYHKLIVEKNNKIPKMDRSEQQGISRYYELKAKYEDPIFKAIYELIKEGKINYAKDLQKIKQK